MTVETRAAKVPLMQRAPGTHGPGLFLESTTHPHATTHPIPASTDVRTHRGLVMVLSRSSSDRSVAAVVAAAGDCEAWPCLEQDVLRPSRSRKVCMTCHWFQHHARPQCIPLLTCH